MLGSHREQEWGKSEKVGDEGKSPHNNLIASWESFPEEKKKEMIKLKPYGHLGVTAAGSRHLTQQNFINSFEIYGVMLQ